ncbi:MAG: MFS transporter [Candidatus Lindowbacteria bacterium]|nr:MFS transporter [Candidatus Lindowbacteria bacterium]
MHIFMYICPALMDWMVFFVLFAVMYTVGEKNFGTGAGSVLGSVVQISYMLSSLGTGMILNRRNARPILLASTLLCGIFSTICLNSQTLWQMGVFITLFGVTLGLFFNSFQTFMRNESAPGGLKWTVALYTLAWSGGAAFGFLSSGYLYAFGKTVMGVTIMAVTLFIFLVLLTRKAKDDGAPTIDDHVEEGSPCAPRATHAYVLVGWMMFFTACFVQRSTCTFYPMICAREGVSSLLTSAPLFIQMAIQALFGFYAFKLRDWLYRPEPQLAFQISTAALLAAAWLWPSALLGAAALALIGFYSGFVSFCAVYYSSNSGNRSFNIGVNEFLVGLGSVAGIFIVEWFVKRSGNENVMFLVCGVCLAASSLAQAVAPRLTGKWGQAEKHG